MNATKTEQQPVFAIGKKVYIRPLLREDLPILHLWINDPEVTQFLATTFPLMLEDEVKFYESLIGDESQFVFAIVTIHENKLIGVMGIHKINWVDRRATTGAYIGEKSDWGKGYGTDAKMLVLKFAFDTLGLRKMCSSVIDYNKRSLAYSLHCGYKEEGRLKKHIFKKGKYRDQILLAVYRKDWFPIWKQYQKTGLVK